MARAISTGSMSHSTGVEMTSSRLALVGWVGKVAPLVDVETVFLVFLKSREFAIDLSLSARKLREKDIAFRSGASVLGFCDYASRIDWLV